MTYRINLAVTPLIEKKRKSLFFGVIFTLLKRHLNNNSAKSNYILKRGQKLFKQSDVSLKQFSQKSISFGILLFTLTFFGKLIFYSFTFREYILECYLCMLLFFSAKVEDNQELISMLCVTFKKKTTTTCFSIIRNIAYIARTTFIMRVVSFNI